jgi:hypothetical protein
MVFEAKISIMKISGHLNILLKFTLMFFSMVYSNYKTKSNSFPPKTSVMVRGVHLPKLVEKGFVFKKL